MVTGSRKDKKTLILAKSHERSASRHGSAVHIDINGWQNWHRSCYK